MPVAFISRRGLLKTALAAGDAYAAGGRGAVVAAPAELKLPDDIPVQKFDFETKGLEGWTTVDGQWAVEDMAGAPSGRRVLYPITCTKHTPNMQGTLGVLPK